MSDQNSGVSGRKDTTGGAKQWFLLEGNRLVIAAGIVVLTLLSLLAILWVYGLDSISPRSPMYFLYGSLLTGDLTLLTVVLSINQLVLSRELGSPKTLRERVGATQEYREEVESTTGSGPSPKSPPAFLRYLHESVRSSATTLENGDSDVESDDLRRRIRGLVDSLVEDTERIESEVDADDPDVFSVVAATLETNHASQLHEIDEILASDAESLGDEQVETLDRLRDLLLQIDVARKYFRTIYVQKELAFLSRILLYVGVPAIVGSGLALVFYNAVIVSTVPAEVFLTVVVGTFLLGYAPLAVLFAFVLRLAWIAQKMASVAPFAAGSTYQ